MGLKRKSLVVGVAAVSVAAVFAGFILCDSLDLSALFDFLFFECLNKNDDLDDIGDGSSLDQDLQEILQILPLQEMRIVIENHAKYNKQISETVSFINDQGRFIWNEIKQIPHARLYLFILGQLGLDTERLGIQIAQFWKELPDYEGGKEEFKNTGLTGMINQILSLIPSKELHELLCRKSNESNSFRTLLSALTFREFEELRKSIQANDLLQRHYFWAKESGTEATFAVEFLGDLYAYLTQRVA